MRREVGSAFANDTRRVCICVGRDSLGASGGNLIETDDDPEALYWDHRKWHLLQWTFVPCQSVDVWLVPG